jgi:hypothetical protein
MASPLSDTRATPTEPAVVPTVLSTEADAHVAAGRSRTPRTLTRTVIR